MYKLLNHKTGETIKGGFKNKQQAKQWAKKNVIWGTPYHIEKMDKK